MEFDEPCWDEEGWLGREQDMLQEEDELREECGVFGCVLAEDARCNTQDSFVAETISLGLHSLQHRGQQSAGIATGSGVPFQDLKVHKNNGLVTKVFTEDVVCKLTGRLGIGHNRYTTTGGNDSTNCQPFVGHNKHGPFALAHNGQLINADSLTKLLFDRGLSLTTRSDSELITQVISLNPIHGEQNGPDWRTRIRFLMKQTPTSYSLAVMNGDKIYAVRDPLGNRPLCVGELRSNESDAESKPLGWLVSSESCAFPPVGARYLREILPGEILEISPKGLKRLDIVHRPKIYRPRATITLEYEESDVNQAASLRNSEISATVVQACCDPSKTGCLGPVPAKHAEVKVRQSHGQTQGDNDNAEKKSTSSKSDTKKESVTLSGQKPQISSISPVKSKASSNKASSEEDSRPECKSVDNQAKQKDGRPASDKLNNNPLEKGEGDLLNEVCSAVSNLSCDSSSSRTSNSPQSSNSSSAVSSSASSCSLSSLSDDDNAQRSKRRCSAAKKCTAPVAFCIFEYVYFARPDSIFEGHSVYEVRYKTGVRLAEEHPVDADFVACIPTTASVAAKGFANKSGLPYMDVLYRSHFVGRSFIESDQNTRKRTVRRKFSLYSERNVRGKRVVLVDDSLVRGTTIEPIVEMLKNAGALEVHFRVASPPIRYPCYMGINIPTKEELAANRAPLDRLAAHWNLDSLKYLSLEGLRAAVNDGLELEENRTVGHCTACLDGIYPVELDW